MLNLRPYQQCLIDETRQHMRRVRRVLIQLPTGGGKTALASRMLHGAADRGKRVWFLVHRRELLKQVSEAFECEGLKHGLVAADQPIRNYAMAQVCSIPTLAKRVHLLPPPDLICWDECHHVASKSWGNIAAKFPKAFHVGLSATPERLDGKGLGKYFDAMVQGPSVAELIEQGYLAKYELIVPPSTIDTSGLRRRMGDFVQSEAAELMKKPSIMGDAISHYRKHCEGKRAVAFCASIERSQETSAAFNAAGIPALHIDGTTDPWLRDQMIADFRAGKVRVICNVELFGEGFDLPAIEASILLRPTQSLAMYLQQVGRALRPSPGKDRAVIIDHVGNSGRMGAHGFEPLHGLPDDEREWILTEESGHKKQKTDVPSPRICPSCSAANRAGTQVCKFCGKPFPVEARKVVQVDGDLAPVDLEKARKCPHGNASKFQCEKCKASRRARQEVGMAQDLEGLIALGRARGYAAPERWAAHVFEGRKQKRAQG
jgi:DNA repair protein RadD